MIGRTPPGVRELKHQVQVKQNNVLRRTPPGVRELKLTTAHDEGEESKGRTPPGVRELKQDTFLFSGGDLRVAPLPGCVN